MPSFSETFRKIFVGTKATTANTNQTTGFITTAGISTASLSVNTGTASTTYGVGSYGFFDASTWKSVSTGSIASTAPNVYLVSASLQLTDKIGTQHGGFIESNKSKMINPKLITAFQKYVPCASRQHTQHIGNTKYTKTLSPTNGDCAFQPVCGESYNIRIQVQNEPALRFLNRDIYRIFTYVAPCCADDAPAANIDGTLMYIDWANQIIADPELKDFVSAIVYSETGVAHYAPGTTGGVYTWDNYVSPGHGDGLTAGMRLTGAYVDTTFGDCSFEPTDYYNKVPVKLISTMVDFEGNQCSFTGVCVVDECLPFSGTGFGETILRNDILSEYYRQNTFPSDKRMREIEMGSDILTGITRTSSYYIYSITHNVPYYNAPGGSYSMDQFTYNIITNGTVATLETFMAALLSNANNPVALETFSCGTCSVLTP